MFINLKYFSKLKVSGLVTDIIVSCWLYVLGILAVLNKESSFIYWMFGSIILGQGILTYHICDAVLALRDRQLLLIADVDKLKKELNAGQTSSSSSSSPIAKEETSSKYASVSSKTASTRSSSEVIPEADTITIENVEITTNKREMFFKDLERGTSFSKMKSEIKAVDVIDEDGAIYIDVQTGNAERLMPLHLKVLTPKQASAMLTYYIKGKIGR